VRYFGFGALAARVPVWQGCTAAVFGGIIVAPGRIGDISWGAGGGA
jgi:hypothetical protein